MVEVEDDRRRRRRGAGDAMVDKRLREAREIRAGHAVFEPAEGRGTCQVLGRIEREAFNTQLEHGVVPQPLGIIASRIP